MSAEPRRVALKTVVPTAGNASGSDKLDANNHKKSKNDLTDASKDKTRRFVLTLTDDDVDGSNEFSFNDLLKALEDKTGTEPNGADIDPDDPLVGEDEKNLRKLEKHFQLKYGPKKRRMIEDHIDKGSGYDDTDPFIDNEEAYDELVPSTLTTKYGGFYINCGKLEFRPLSPDANISAVADEEDVENDDEDNDEDNIRPVLKRKKKLKLMNQKKRRSSAELAIQKSVELIHKSAMNKIQSLNNKTVAQMIQHKKSTKPNLNHSIGNNNIKTTNNDNVIEEIQLNDSDEDEEVAAVPPSVSDVINSVAKGRVESISDHKNNTSIDNQLKTSNVDIKKILHIDHKKTPIVDSKKTTTVEIKKTSPVDTKKTSPVEQRKASPVDMKKIDIVEKKPLNGNMEAEDVNNDSLVEMNLNLHEGLPHDVLLLIDKIQNLTDPNGGKRTLFTQEINKLLFDVDVKTRSLPVPLKTQMYSYMASKLPVTKQTLISKVKKASAETFDYELNTALAQIVQIIKNLTPIVFENYQTAMNDAKALCEYNQKFGIQSEVKVPRKVFGFSTDLRRQLNTAVNAKINLYDQSNHKSQNISLRDYLNEFLDQKIRPLFPNGWMSVDVLKRKIKWLKELLPPEPSSQQSSQSRYQMTAQSSQSSAARQTVHSTHSSNNRPSNRVSQSQSSLIAPSTTQSSHSSSSQQSIRMSNSSVGSSQQLVTQSSHITGSQQSVRSTQSATHLTHASGSQSANRSTYSSSTSQPTTQSSHSSGTPTTIQSAHTSSSSSQPPLPAHSSGTPVNIRSAHSSGSSSPVIQAAHSSTLIPGLSVYPHMLYNPHQVLNPHQLYTTPTQGFNRNSVYHPHSL